MKNKVDLNYMIMEAFDIDETDLEAYRDGRHSPRQFDMLYKQMRRYHALRIIVPVIAAIAILAQAFFQQWIMALLVFCAAGLITLYVLKILERSQSHLSGTVDSISGVIQLSEYRASPLFVTLTIDGESFVMPTRMVSALRNGDSYTVYHVNNRIIAMEWLGS